MANLDTGVSASCGPCDTLAHFVKCPSPDLPGTWLEAMSTSESFQHLALRFTDPIQHDYEVIRGIMLEDASIAERSRITGVDQEEPEELTRGSSRSATWSRKATCRTLM